MAQAMRMHTQGCSRDPTLYAARDGGGLPAGNQPTGSAQLAQGYPDYT